MKRNWYALAGGALLAACVLAFSGCPEKETSYGDDGVAKSLKITGFADADINKAITVSVMVGYTPKAGGEGTVSGDSVTLDLYLPNKDEAGKEIPWTGNGGPYVVWMVTGDIAAAHDAWEATDKSNPPSTTGITGKQAQTDIISAETAVDFSAGTNTEIPLLFLQQFIQRYSPEGDQG